MRTIGNAIDLDGQIINGLRITGRASLRPLRWFTECIRCGSTKTFDHVRLMQAASGALNAAHCALDNCFLFKSVSRPIPPTERPKHEPTVTAPPVASPASVHKPVPLDPLLSDYRRFEAASRQWGNEPCDLESFRQVARLKPDFFKTMMSNVEQFEIEQEETAKGIEFAEQMESENFQRIIQTYGIDMCSNVRRTQ